MKAILLTLLAFGSAAVPEAVSAADSIGFDPPRTGTGELPPYLECVPFARSATGIEIYGDAWTWWDKADGLYARGNRPQVGAVMAFASHGNMRLGHVAAVARVVDSRTVLLDHSNWSPIDGRRGQIERGVRAIDVSPANDWSQVRVWYAPNGDLGTTAWPVHGFIYPKATRGRTPAPRTTLAAAPQRAVSQPQRAVLSAPAAPVQPARQQPAASFAAAFADLSAPQHRATRAPVQIAAAEEDVIGEIIRRRR